ncbi:MAG: hypothetical protein HON27_17860 [Candidatus Marinimicrobia bacterium]|jgi:hypothetical protein|nr:hypothetical protein [Candidatus Neomarinimicrobiota bacterium]MBT4948015.1 hypothetical protein [Candidatus Neomarinimicrobiota bacterium]MBT5269783.1 hypothetical protein [Candidatus Neomarinimicrobiota bacterium]
MKKCERNDVLQKILALDVLRKETELSPEQLAEVNFEVDTDDVLVNALKKMIFIYCQDGSEISTLRTVNSYLQNEVK